MKTTKRHILGLHRSGALCVALVLLVCTSASAQADGRREYVPPGKLNIEGRTLTCGQKSTIIAPRFRGIAAARPGRPGTIILNPRRLARQPAQVQWLVYYHECGHHYIGVNETAADCWAVNRARREGWLTLDGIRQTCDLLMTARSDRFHPPAPVRCRIMTSCYDNSGREIAAEAKAFGKRPLSFLPPPGMKRRAIPGWHY